VDILLAISGIIMLLLGIYLCIRPHIPSVIASYGGIWLLQWSDILDFPSVMLSYWGIMVVIVVTILSMLPPTLVKATQGLVPMTVTSVAGMALGLTMGYAPMIVGAAVGTVAGAVFFSRTPKGAGLGFPSSRFLQYLCAKGFPVVISVSLTGIAMMLALMKYNSL